VDCKVFLIISKNYCLKDKSCSEQTISLKQSISAVFDPKRMIGTKGKTIFVSTLSYEDWSLNQLTDKTYAGTCPVASSTTVSVEWPADRSVTLTSNNSYSTKDENLLFKFQKHTFDMQRFTRDLIQKEPFDLSVEIKDSRETNANLITKHAPLSIQRYLTGQFVKSNNLKVMETKEEKWKLN
jgi:hypothetical protein